MTERIMYSERHAEYIKQENKQQMILVMNANSGVATGVLGGRVPPLVPRTDCGIRPDPMRSW